MSLLDSIVLGVIFIGLFSWSCFVFRLAIYPTHQFQNFYQNVRADWRQLLKFIRTLLAWPRTSLSRLFASDRMPLAKIRRKAANYYQRHFNNSKSSRLSNHSRKEVSLGSGAVGPSYVPIAVPEAVDALVKYTMDDQLKLLQNLQDIFSIEAAEIRPLDLGHMCLFMISLCYQMHGLRGPSESSDVLGQVLIKFLEQSRSYKTAGMSIGNAAIEYEKRNKEYNKIFGKIAQQQKSMDRAANAIPEILRLSILFCRNAITNRSDDFEKLVEKEVVPRIVVHMKDGKSFVANQLCIPTGGV